MPSQTPARGQKAIEPLLVHLIHMQQTIAGSLVESSILDVLADDPGALLVAAAKEIAAVVMMYSLAGFVSAIVLVWETHCCSLRLARSRHHPLANSAAHPA